MEIFVRAVERARLFVTATHNTCVTTMLDNYVTGAHFRHTKSMPVTSIYCIYLHRTPFRCNRKATPSFVMRNVYLHRKIKSSPQCQRICG